MRRAKAGAPSDQPKDNNDPGTFGKEARLLHSFTGLGNRHERKVLLSTVEVNPITVDIPRWLNWSEHPITWSRADHAPQIEYPGQVALVVKPKVSDYWLPKMLMDGGSSINILYYDTFRRLNLPESMIEATMTTFHGSSPVGRNSRSAR